MMLAFLYCSQMCLTQTSNSNNQTELIGLWTQPRMTPTSSMSSSSDFLPLPSTLLSFPVRACRATIASARLPLPSYDVWNAPHFNRQRSPVRPVVAHAEESRSDALSRLVSAHVHIEHTIRHGTSYWASRGRVSESLRAGSQEYVRLSNIAVDRLPSTVRSRPSVPSYVSSDAQYGPYQCAGAMGCSIFTVFDMRRTYTKTAGCLTQKRYRRIPYCNGRTTYLYALLSLFDFILQTIFSFQPTPFSHCLLLLCHSPIFLSIALLQPWSSPYLRSTAGSVLPLPWMPMWLLSPRG